MYLIRYFLLFILICSEFSCIYERDVKRYFTVFGQEFNYSGKFNKDSVENGIWQFISSDKDVKYSGIFRNGFKNETWVSIYGNKEGHTAFWAEYSNRQAGIQTSFPFQVGDTILDDGRLRVRTDNDSLGFISFLILANNPTATIANVDSTYISVNNGFLEMNYEFSFTAKKCENSDGVYMSIEYDVLDQENKPGKIYYVNGYSKKYNYFLEVSMLHQGPNEKISKEIFSFVLANLYWRNKRYFNPFKQNRVTLIKEGFRKRMGS